MWAHPDLLPDADDLDNPAGFIDRLLGGDDLDDPIAQLEKTIAEEKARDATDESRNDDGGESARGGS